MEKLYIELTEQKLIVANTGQPFSRKGVISICAAHLSEKTNKIDDSYGKSLIKDIRKQYIKEWHGNPNRLQSDINTTEGTQDDYQGRVILELLQNCLDAIGERNAPIGAKGLGFKSVFNISNAPQIYSDKFHFCFDGAKTKKELERDEKLKDISKDKPESTLAMLLPHEIQPEDSVRDLLQQDYATIIYLPLPNSDTFARIKNEINAVIAHPYFLLFASPVIDEMIIKTPSKEFKTSTKEQQNKYHIYQQYSEGKNKSQEIKIAIPKTFDPIDDNVVQVYFPTEERIELNAILHGNFNVTSNRNQIQKKDLNDGADT